MQQLGYDKPAWQQYFFYLADVVQGDLGKSVVTRQSVLQEFFTLFPATLELSICAILFALVIGLPAGIIAAVRRGSAYDHTLRGVALTGKPMRSEAPTSTPDTNAHLVCRLLLDKKNTNIATYRRKHIP